MPDIGGLFGAMDPSSYGGSYYSPDGAFRQLGIGGADGESGSGRAHQRLFMYQASLGEFHGNFEPRNTAYENYVYGKSDHVTVTNFTNKLWKRIN